MLTASGISIVRGELALPTASDFAIQMGRITRYGGAIWCPLLFHSLLVALMLEDEGESPITIIAGLLHDAHEIILGEIPHNWKTGDRKRDEESLDALIFRAAGLDDSINFSAIKNCDRRALAFETYHCGPLENWRNYALRWGESFNGWETADEGFFIAQDLRRNGFANPGLTTSIESRPIEEAERLFWVVFNQDHKGAVRILRMMRTPMENQRDKQTEEI